jgi:WD40 repeat protein
VGLGDGARLWDLATGREFAYLPDGWTDSVSFVSRPDGRELLTCGYTGLRRWPIREEPESPGRVRIGPSHTIGLPYIPDRAHVSRDGQTVAVASERSGTALVVDLATEAVRCTLAPHPGLNRAVLSPDGRWVVTSGWHTQSVKIWDARTGAVVKELRLGVTNNAFFSPDGRTLVTSLGEEYRFWDVETWKPARRLAWDIPSYPGWVAFSPDRTLLALELSPAFIHLIDAATGRTLAKLEDPRSDRAQWLGFTPDGAGLVAIATYSKAIHVWDLRAIRRHLATMDLDWESPSYPPAPVYGEPLRDRLVTGPDIVARPFASFGPDRRYFVDLGPGVRSRIPHSDLKFTGRWGEAGTFRFSNEVGATAEGQFEGTGVRWLGWRFDDGGTAEVAIDDKVVAIVNQHGPGRYLPFEWSYRGLAPGRHTIRIRVLAEKLEASSDRYANVARLDVLIDPAP